MKSMTGYSHLSLKKAKLFFDIKIRSVNHRYFSFSINSPKEYRHLDVEVQRKIKKYIKRGSVDVFFYRRCSDSSKDVLNLDLKKLKSWDQVYSKMAKSLKIPYRRKLEDFIQRSDLVYQEESSILSKSEEKLFFSFLEKAIKELDYERKREGLALKKNFLNYLKELSKIVLKMSQIHKGEMKQLKNQKQKELQKSKHSGHQMRNLLNEIDKLSLEEEIKRLKTHLTYTKKLLSGVSKGKKIDFYSQEILREINTIGSKAEKASLIHLVVEAKDLVEKIREQVQNVE